MTPLSAAEARALGALIEKKFATPEYYPLTLNSLLLACNQKSNREPVMELSEAQAAAALAGLLERQLAYESPGSRSVKYGENLTGPRQMIGAESAALCVLLLRGPQTPGEIKGRTGRMHEWRDLAEVESTLEALIERGMAVKLPRAAGRKENRYAETLSGVPAAEEEPRQAGAEAPAMAAAREDAGRLGALEEEVRSLRAELADLREAFMAFRKQFE